MPIFYNPHQSGKGVAKTEPEKRAFFKFFELVSRKFWKLIQLNAVYLLLCIPVITVGPATAALVHVMRKFALEQPIFVISEFFSAFKKNFLQSLAVGVIDVVFTLAILYSAYFYWVKGDVFLIAMTMVSAAIFTTLNLYIYPQIVSLNLKLPAIFKNAVLLGVVGLKRNLIALGCFVLAGSLLVLLFPYSLFALLIAPAFMAFLAVFTVYPVIQKFIVNPYYEKKGEKNPEIPDYAQTESIFTDLGGKEAAVNKKNVKIGGKVIK